MLPISKMPASICREIETLFTDIDDTLTTDGLVPALTFSALWRAREAGRRVVLVTGRPAGWCDHLARMWPVSAVVGENGALAFALIDGRIQRLYADRPPDAQERLAIIERQILTGIPGAKVSADQPYREYDLAIDFCEEVPPLSERSIDRIVEIFEQHGATAKVSSIHVNGWFGAFDKLTMCERAMREFFGSPLDIQRATYMGDSPNDVPMFRQFPHSCGVANVQQLKHRMDALPTYITKARGGEGFAELVDHLLKSE